MSSILNDVKHYIGLLPEQNAFDSDIIIGINSALAVLHQLGVGPVEGFSIQSDAQTWSEFIDDPRANTVQTYVFQSVKLLIDPPRTGFETAARERQLRELEFRINVLVDTG